MSNWYSHIMTPKGDPADLETFTNEWNDEARLRTATQHGDVATTIAAFIDPKSAFDARIASVAGRPQLRFYVNHSIGYDVIALVSRAWPTIQFDIVVASETEYLKVHAAQYADGQTVTEWNTQELADSRTARLRGEFEDMLVKELDETPL